MNAFTNLCIGNLHLQRQFLFCRHEKVLEGLAVSAEMKNMDRFDMIITGLGMGINGPLQVGCMQLVNAIICTPHENLDFRLHLRNEFMRCGLQDLIKVHDNCYYFHYAFYSQNDSKGKSTQR